MVPLHRHGCQSAADLHPLPKGGNACAADRVIRPPGHASAACMTLGSDSHPSLTRARPGQLRTAQARETAELKAPQDASNGSIPRSCPRTIARESERDERVLRSILQTKGNLNHETTVGIGAPRSASSRPQHPTTACFAQERTLLGGHSVDMPARPRVSPASRHLIRKGARANSTLTPG